jgi:phenylacetate-CoA ligase
MKLRNRSTTLRPDIQAKLQFLLSSQYWPIDKLREYQWEKIEQLVQHAAKTVPYYRDLFATHGISADQMQSYTDLTRIPPMTRAGLRQHVDSLISTTADVRSLHLERSGGSTGEPVACYQDPEYLSWAAAARIRAWKYVPGFDEHTREALLWGADRDIADTLRLTEICAILTRGRDLRLNTFAATDHSYRRFAALFRLLRPKILRGYASSLIDFCTVLNTRRITLPPPAAIISSAEVLAPAARTALETTLAGRVFDSYGCREVSLMAMECPHQCGLHVAMENNYLEIEQGKILVTNLNNFAMPLLRYEVGDLADNLNDRPCGCGRGQVRLERIQGRVSDTLHFCGRSVHAEFIAHLFYTDTTVSRFQILKNEQANRLTILIDRPDPRIEDLLQQRLEQKFPGVDVQVIVTSTFTTSGTGKLQLVIDENHPPT